MNTQDIPVRKIHVEISEKNIPTILSALELKLKALQKMSNGLIKERQLKAANDVQPDILFLQNLIRYLTPKRPVPLPFSPSKP